MIHDTAIMARRFYTGGVKMSTELSMQVERINSLLKFLAVLMFEPIISLVLLEGKCDE